MARSTSASSSQGSSGPDSAPTVVPPWERRPFVQVPYVKASSPALQDVERRVGPEIWPARSHHLSPKAMPSASSAAAAEDAMNTWNRNPNAYWTFLPPRTKSAPYETPACMPPASNPPPFPRQYAMTAPPTPPDSASNSSTFSSTVASPEQSARIRPVTAMPGTMSVRTGESSRNRSKASHHDRGASDTLKSESAGFGKRFKSAFKDIFRRNSIDESEFETIEERHWTEDY